MAIRKRWFVYLLMYGDVVLYVGKGQGNRHLVSQRRHGGVPVIVKHFARETAALRHEVLLIEKYKPQCNRSRGGEGVSRKSRPDDALIERRWRDEAYAKENSGFWLDKLAALAYRKCEENDRLRACASV